MGWAGGGSPSHSNFLPALCRQPGPTRAPPKSTAAGPERVAGGATGHPRRALCELASCVQPPAPRVSQSSSGWWLGRFGCCRGAVDGAAPTVPPVGHTARVVLQLLGLAGLGVVAGEWGFSTACWGGEQVHLALQRGIATLSLTHPRCFGRFSSHSRKKNPIEAYICTDTHSYHGNRVGMVETALPLSQALDRTDRYNAATFCNDR